MQRYNISVCGVESRINYCSIERSDNILLGGSCEVYSEMLFLFMESGGYDSVQGAVKENFRLNRIGV